MRVDTRNIVATVAFLIGLRRNTWNNVYGDEHHELLEELDNNQAACTIRYLCKLRAMLMQHFKKTDNSIRFEFKNIDRLEWFDSENIKQLEEWGFKILLTNKRASDYNTNFNKLICENIHGCKELFPDWISWDYIKNLFVIPHYSTENVQKLEFEKYMANIVYYPYQMYIYWKKPCELGNMLYNDGKFLDILYKMNGANFTDSSKYKNAVDDVKTNIYDFINASEKTVLAVDCENSDVYKLYGMLKNLNQDEIEKIHKIILFDDNHTTNGWDYLEKFLNIPVEHIEVERVVDRKSLVDIRVTMGICKEYYENKISSFILLSSDSDYWGLISSLPQAKFLVVIEYDKCGQPIRDILDTHEIYYCSLDDFCTGNIEELKKAVLISELKKYLPDIVNYNGKQLAYDLFEKARINASENEIKNFYDKYIKTIRLNLDNDGNFSIVLR